jgi:hypothetical protein
MPVRMKDIAEAVGVSIVTVSKALRHHPDIAVETRQRILDRVKALNYRPNLMARSLVTGHSELIGLVVPDLVHPFFGEIAKALSAQLRQKNFFLIVSSSDGDPALEQAEIEHLLAYRLDALVVASCQPNAANLARIAEHGTPLVLLDRSFPSLDVHFVGADDYRMGVLATEHLIASGRTRIAHMRGPANSVGESRLRGFVDTMKAHGLGIPDGYVSPKPAGRLLLQRRAGAGRDGMRARRGIACTARTGHHRLRQLPLRRYPAGAAQQRRPGIGSHGKEAGATGTRHRRQRRQAAHEAHRAAAQGGGSRFDATAKTMNPVVFRTGFAS